MPRWFLLTLALCLASAPSTKAKPNVLFIAIDDLNDWIGCLQGHPQALTPNIDRLARRGVLFSNAHCAAPACNPSRAALFSGKTPLHTGVWNNQSGSLEKLSPNSQLLPTTFKQSGYTTLGTGKLLHSGGKTLYDNYFSVNQRWSPFPKDAVKYAAAELPSKGSPHPAHVLKDSLGRTVILPLNRMPSDRKPNNPAGESFDWGGFDLPDSDFGDTQITDWAIDQLLESRARPLFLAVGYYRPHIPLWAPQRFFDRFKETPGILPPIQANDLDDLGSTAKQWAREAVTAGSHDSVLKHRQWQQAVEAYLACVSYIDHEIGRLLNALDNSKLADSTLVVLWSDHGWHLGEKEHWGKWTGWERSTRVPLIMVPPNNKAPRFATEAVCKTPVSLLDLYPTLVELCQLTGPDTLDGQSLTPLLQNPNRSTNRVAVTYFDRGNLTVRDHRWRYIRYADTSEELYDTMADPNEWTNLVTHPQHASIHSNFRTQVIELLSRQ